MASTRSRGRRVAFVVLLFVLAPLAARADSDRLLVFAAASLQNAMAGVVGAYTSSHAGTIKVSYAGSSTLARQIEQGAPADLFISANRQWMDTLAEDGLIVAGSRVALLRNAVVLVARRASAIDVKIEPGFDLVAKLHGGRLSMAGVESVPAGIYGRQALMALQVWRSVAPHVAQGADVRAALALVARGQAPLGVVYKSDAVAEKRVRVVATFPADSHDPIVYPAAIVQDARTPLAESFLRFLQGRRAARIFRKWGFRRAGR